jgi:hypothetical protein
MMGVRTRLCSLAVTVLCFAGCGSSADFTNSHVFELQKDCTETLRCKSGSIEFASSDDMTNCVSSAGRKLENAGDEKQNTFLETVARCQQLQVCDYLSCTQSDPNMGYAGAHQDAINYDCTQQIACKIAMGQQQAMNAVLDCVTIASNTLNFAPTQQQQQFEAKAARCAGQQSCNWVNCQ